MAIQMVVVVIVCVCGGIELDDWRGNDSRGFTIGLTVFGIIAAMYILFKAVRQSK